MPKTWTTPSEMLRWLDKATPSEIYAKALKCDDRDAALTMCDHVLLKVDFKQPLSARTHFLKGRLFLSEEPEMSVDQFRKGLFDAKDVIPENDPEVVEAKRVLQDLCPANPDDELVDSYVDKIDEYVRQVAKKFGNCEVERRLSHEVSEGWRDIELITGFNNHVQVEGLEGYFSNTLGHDQQAIIAAFKVVDKDLHAVVTKAFDVFKANRHLHESSKASLEDFDDPYEAVEEEYLNFSEHISPILAGYIRNHKNQFKPLPAV